MTEPAAGKKADEMAHHRRLERIAACVVSPTVSAVPVSATIASPLEFWPPGCPAPPVRTTNVGEALVCLRRDGYSVYRTEHYGQGLGESEMRRVAAAMPKHIFGDSLAQHKMPERIAGGGWDGRQWRGHPVKGPDRGHIPNAPHMDSPPWGDLKSDYFLMVGCEAPDSSGGSFMLDGYGLLDGLPAFIRDAFWSVPTQRRGTGDGSQGCVWRSPNAKRTAAGRIFLRGPNGGHSSNRPDIDEPVADFQQEGVELIDGWRSAVIKAAPLAPRFRVAPGEVLLIDNYRMLHARDPYVGGRIMFRVHCWTDERMYLLRGLYLSQNPSIYH